MASYNWPPTQDLSVGPTGVIAPLYATEIGGIDIATGFLEPYSATAPGVEGTVVMTVQGAAAGVPINTNVVEWGGVATTLGQKVMASSVPVVIASDQSDVPVNIDKYGGVATTLGQKVMASSEPVVIASDQSPIPVTPAALSVFDVNLTEVGGSAIVLGQAVMAASLPVVIASDQTDLPINIDKYGGTATSLGQKVMASSIPVVIASDQSTIPVSAIQAGNVPYNLVRNVYSSTNVTTAAYVQLVASTSEVTNAVEIFDSSGQTLAIAFGGSGSEVNQFYVYPGGNGRIPCLIPTGTRVSIIAISANATAGEIDINFYN